MFQKLPGNGSGRRTRIEARGSTKERTMFAKLGLNDEIKWGGEGSNRGPRQKGLGEKRGRVRLRDVMHGRPICSSKPLSMEDRYGTAHDRKKRTTLHYTRQIPILFGGMERVVQLKRQKKSQVVVKGRRLEKVSSSSKKGSIFLVRVFAQKRHKKNKKKKKNGNTQKQATKPHKRGKDCMCVLPDLRGTCSTTR